MVPGHPANANDPKDSPVELKVIIVLKVTIVLVLECQVDGAGSPCQPVIK